MAATKKPKKAGKRGQNEGSIYKGKDGRWRAIVPAKYSSTGKRKMIVGSIREGNTREIVAEKLAKALAATPTAQRVIPSRETVGTLADRWLAHMAGEDAADAETGDEAQPLVRYSTLETYKYAVATYIKPAIGGVKIQALEDRHVKTMLARIRSEGKALRSVRYARSVLRMILKYAVAQKLVPRNVADDVAAPTEKKKATETERRWLNSAEAVKLLAAVKGTDGEALITTVLSLGLRIGEALGLRWSDVDLGERTVRIAQAYQRQGKSFAFVEPKTEKSRRTLLLSSEMVALLKAHRKRQIQHRLKAGAMWRDFGLVFASRVGTPISPRNALRALHTALDHAEIPRRRMHDLRHSAATILLLKRVPLQVVSSILGHSSIRVTADVYGGNTLEAQEQAAAVMSGILSGPKAAK